jgi:hypothetical protein
LETVFLHAGAETHAVAAGSIYLGSGLGLDQLDPNSRRSTLVDDDPGSISRRSTTCCGAPPGVRAPSTDTTLAPMTVTSN